MTPIGYGKNTLGTCLGVFILLGGVWLTTMLMKSSADMSEARYIMIGAAVLAFLFIMMDLTNNLKNRNNIEYMHRMLEYPSVKGKIVEIKKYHSFLGRDNEVALDDHTYRQHYVYRVVVSFYDEESRCEKWIRSESYARNPKRRTLSDRVDVHYSPAGDYWIELDVK